ncbi:hypothetical protein DMN91_000358 [Ooceraea biroi]|uniref:Uncharacterized protein n=1 Tax=Ooceraea biroi TaxID=2015173 RepID=A0A3L8E208_OOCBI|nr:hypothetical protein DMN91_000358 [Ooceraea biroi]
MHLIRKIKGSGKSDESQQEDMMEICSSYAKERTLLNNDDGVRERASSVSASSRSIDDDTDGWITEEDKNLLRYYYYILHEVDDARAGTLDSDTLKKITSMVSAEWQERHNEYLGRLIHEIKRDYVTSMKKSIVDFVLQEPFEEVYEFFAPPLLSRGIIDPYSPERGVKYTKIRAKLEKRSIVLYHPCIRKTLDYWHREYGKVKQVDKQELASYGKSYDLSSFDFQFSRILRSTNDDLLKRWLPKICNILLAALKKKTLPSANDPEYNRFFNCLAYVMEDQLRDLCLRSMEDYINYLMDVGGINCGFNIHLVIRNTSISFDPTFKMFVDTLSTLLNSLYEFVTTLPRAEIKLGWVQSNTGLLKPIISSDVLEQHMNTISNLIQRYRINPELQLHEFDKYISLINDEDVNYVEDFLKTQPPKPYEKYCELVQYYDQLSKNIPLEFYRTSFTDLFEVRRHHTIDHIVSTATNLRNEIVSKMVADYQQKVRAIGDVYQDISTKP